MNKENPVLRSLDIIESRISERLTVENIASSVYFSKYHYSRLFREVMGDSVIEYVIKRKLTLAGKALLETDSTILDVALQYGYDSHEGFSRSFKAYMGVSPTDYRKYGLASISKKTKKEKEIMVYSKTTDEIIRELNDFITKASDATSFKQIAALINKIKTDMISQADDLKDLGGPVRFFSETFDKIAEAIKHHS